MRCATQQRACFFSTGHQSRQHVHLPGLYMTLLYIKSFRPCSTEASTAAHGGLSAGRTANYWGQKIQAVQH